MMTKIMIRKVLIYFFALYLLSALGSLPWMQKLYSIHDAHSAQVEEINLGFPEFTPGVPPPSVESLSASRGERLLAAITMVDTVSGESKDMPDLPASATSKPPQPPFFADFDGDGLSDGLQDYLATALPNDLVDVIVRFSGPGNAASSNDAVGPFHIKHQYGIISGFAATMTVAQVKGLAKTPGIFRIEEDFKVSATLDAANHDFGTQLARQEFGVTGNGVSICVVDTGVDPNHEQLNEGKVIGFVDYINGYTTAYDDQGHGTHVSSIAAGDGRGGVNADSFKGVAPDASIY
jgi:serine protease AprX